MPPGAQFRNGLAERRVASLKSTLNHLLANTIVSEKPTLHYAELQTLLSRAANIVNDRPIGVRSLTEDELVPLTVNQLLLGRQGLSCIFLSGSARSIPPFQDQNISNFSSASFK